jgi:hypothetical protein
MATYKIIPKGDQVGFDVEIVGNDGARQTLLGFETQAEAQTWISRDRWVNVADDPWTPAHSWTPEF